MKNVRSKAIRVLAAGAIAAVALAGCGGGSNTPSTSKKCQKHPQWKVCKGQTTSSS
jgi:hypothetical protein